MICKYCGEDRLDSQFEIANTIKGKEYKRKKCHICYQQDKNERRKSIRVWLDDHKKTLHCGGCGNTDYRCLDFHHIGDKSIAIANAARGSWSINKIKEEIEKCEVLCANCHRILHHEERCRGVG